MFIVKIPFVPKDSVGVSATQRKTKGKIITTYSHMF